MTELATTHSDAARLLAVEVLLTNPRRCTMIAWSRAFIC